MHVQSYRFAYRTDWCFWRSCCRPRYWILKSRIIISSHRNLWFAPCKGIWIPESGNFFLWNPENFSCGIRQIFLLESGIQIKEWGIPLMIGLRNPFHWQRIQNPESSAWNSESTAWNPEYRTVLGIQGCGALGWFGSGSVIRDHSDHGRSNEPMNPLWTRILRFIWSTMIRVISSHRSWCGSS